MRARLAWLLLPLAAGCPRPEADSPPEPAATTLSPAAIEDPATCAPCHAAVVEEWQGSMHARAHTSRDPIFARVRAARTKREGPDTPKACASCHGPRAPGEPDGALAARGVTCAACHAVAHVKSDARGAPALAPTEPGVLLGPHDTEAAAHGGGPAPKHMTDGETLCLACHGALHNPANVPICTTGPEHAEAAAQTCVECHMPAVGAPSGSVSQAKGHRSHRFVGPRGAWNDANAFAFMRRSVEARAALEGANLQVRLTNRSGHAFPSGFPGRMAAVVVTGFDVGGAATWTPPPRPLRKVYVDEAGRPTLAPYAKTLREDSRLKADESRVLAYEGVPEAVTRVEAKVMFRLLTPPLTRKLGFTKDPLGGARLVATATAAR